LNNPLLNSQIIKPNLALLVKTKLDLDSFQKKKRIPEIILSAFQCLTTLKKVQSREKASTIKKKSKNLLFFS
jgi:hypothetical protein